ncbi:hypothetical protein SRRS_11760 [Sporomusa rhizae]|uniref:hypothetical protein n=1 Tax=Sporomusa rhizae TaxID=357999 RepID=UPI00352AF9AD
MGKSYLDERIRSVINQAEEQERINSQSIYEGITINGRYYEFQEMAFFDDQFKIQMPTAFFDMPLNLARIKYPSGDRPQIIRTEDTGSINITLNRITNNVCEDQIPEVKDGLKTILKRLNPSYLFFEEGVETVNEKQVGFFEFKSPTLDKPLFNLMFVVTLDRDVILGVFNCPYEDYREWRPIARQIMESIQVIPQQGNAAECLGTGGEGV